MKLGGILSEDKEIVAPPKGEAAIPDVILLFSFATGIYLRLGIRYLLSYIMPRFDHLTISCYFTICEKSPVFLEKF
jgi:hypothetical protein